MSFLCFSLLFHLVFTRRVLTLIFAFFVRFTYREFFPFYVPCYFYLYVFLLFSYRRLTADPGTWIPFVFMSGQSRREQRRRKCRGISKYGAYSEIESDSGVQSTIGEDVASVVGEASLVVSIEEHESENMEGDELSDITVRESDRIPLDSVVGVGQERDESVVRSKSRETVRATTHHRSVSRASRNGGASMVPSTTWMSHGRERERRERAREIVESVLDDDLSSEGDRRQSASTGEEEDSLPPAPVAAVLTRSARKMVDAQKAASDNVKVDVVPQLLLNRGQSLKRLSPLGREELWVGSKWRKAEMRCVISLLGSVVLMRFVSLVSLVVR